MARRLDDGSLDELIFARRIMDAVTCVMKDRPGAQRRAFSDALRLVWARHDRLRETAPGLFSVEPDEYWEGFRVPPPGARRAAPALEAPKAKPDGTTAQKPKTNTLRTKAQRTQAAKAKRTRGAKAELAAAPRRKGERRIVVDGVAYYWRVPRRPNTDQHDLAYASCAGVAVPVWGVFAIVRPAEAGNGELKLVFPQEHPGQRGNGARTAEARARRRALQLAHASARAPVLPRDVAQAIRGATANGWRPTRFATFHVKAAPSDIASDE